SKRDWSSDVCSSDLQGFSQFLLIHIVLVLSHANGLRINLHKLCQRILYTSRDGRSTSLSHVEIRKLFRSQFARGIHRSTCLIGRSEERRVGKERKSR